MKNFTLKSAFLATSLALSSFSAFAVLPQVDSVASVIGITRTTAYSGSFVTCPTLPVASTDSIKERGVCVNTTGNPVITDTKFPAYKSIPNTAYEPAALSGLTANTLYYVRAYATNAAGETSYSVQKQFTTSANDVEAIWTLKSNLTATVSGAIAAQDLDHSKVCTGVSYDQNSGGNGTTTVLFPAPTGLLKESAGLMTLATYDSNIYFAFSVTPTNKTVINQLALTGYGYKTGSMNVKIDYSFDNFATAGTTLTDVKFNDALRTQLTTSNANFPSANPALTTLMGKENASWPASINVNAGQTVSFRMYLWGKAGSGILMKNLIVSGASDLGTTIKKIDVKSNTLSVISTYNTLRVENASNISKFEIVSINGCVLQSGVNSKTEINLNISGLQHGIYFARAYTANGIQTCKFVK